jgi:hypothetical protein
MKNAKSAGKSMPFSAAARGKNAPQSVSYFTFGRRKICKPYLAKMGDENASHRSHRMDRRRRPGRAWPALVDCRDVQIGPLAQRGNQLARDAVKAFGVSSGAERDAVPMPLPVHPHMLRHWGRRSARHNHAAPATDGCTGTGLLSLGKRTIDSCAGADSMSPTFASPGRVTSRLCAARSLTRACAPSND